MFGIGWTEFVLIALVLLIFVGPRHLPSMMQKTARILAELRTASRELRNQVSEEVRDIERAVGDIPSPSKIAKELQDEMVSSMKEASPYGEVAQAGEEIAREVESIKKGVLGDEAVSAKTANEGGGRDQMDSITSDTSPKSTTKKRSADGS